jgi:hypothetical protein
MALSGPTLKLQYLQLTKRGRSAISIQRHLNELILGKTYCRL